MVSKLQKKDYAYAVICIALTGFGIFANAKYGFNLFKILSYASLSLGCLIAARVDYREHIIPNKILVVLLIIRAIMLLGDTVWGAGSDQGVLRFTNVIRSFAGMFIGFAIMILVYVISKHAIGMGDVKLSAVIGFYMWTQGWYTSLIFGSVLAALFSIVQLLRKKMTLKDEIPLGPFLAAGVVIAVIIGA